MNSKGLMVIEEHVLRRMLELPEEVVITGVDYDYETGDLKIVLRSKEPLGIYTQDVPSFHQVRRTAFKPDRKN